MGDLYIGERIALLRKGRGMTQRQLAEQLGVSDKAVSRWERGESAPDLTLIPELADLFSITCDELLRGEARSPAAHQTTVPAPKKLRNYTTISYWLLLLGLVAALVCYLGLGYRYGVLGFCLELAFCIGAGICQTIGTLSAQEKPAVKKDKAANVAILALTILSGTSLIMNSSLDIGEILFLASPLASIVLLAGLFLKWFVLCRNEKLHALRSGIAGATTGTLIATALLTLLLSMAYMMSEVGLIMLLILTPIEIAAALCIYLWKKKQLK